MHRRATRKLGSRALVPKFASSAPPIRTTSTSSRASIAFVPVQRDLVDRTRNGFPLHRGRIRVFPSTSRRSLRARACRRAGTVALRLLVEPNAKFGLRPIPACARPSETRTPSRWTLSISRIIAFKCRLTASPSGESRTGGPRSNKGPPSSPSNRLIAAERDGLRNPAHLSCACKQIGREPVAKRSSALSQTSRRSLYAFLPWTWAVGM
jgi:hypothetical protein